ncbi:MAG: hypothetical protein KAT15_09480, partial [Bacteroidales bacterium]|nr:hypothetical protein [Bacteroidales bacterium]
NLAEQMDGGTPVPKKTVPADQMDGGTPVPKKTVPADQMDGGTPQKCLIGSGWKIYDPQKSDDFISAELERVWKLKFGELPVYTNDPDESNAISLEIADPDIPGPDISQPETSGPAASDLKTSDPDHINAVEGSYILRVESKRIGIRSRSRQGLWYGVNTLLQALEQNNEIPVGEIVDRPEYPVRSTLQSVGGLTPEFIQYIEQIARLRYNVVYISSGNYLEMGDEQKVKDIKEVFDFCKSRFIEPVPYFETFGAGTITRVMDPCLDEGIYHEKESWHVPDNGIIELNVPRILDCPGTTIHVFTPDGEELERNKDFQLRSAEKPVLQILSNDYLNRELLLSYDAVDFSLSPHPAS